MTKPRKPRRKPVKTLFINRDIWLRGPIEKPVLYRPADGKLDALGMYLHAYGIPLEKLADKEDIHGYGPSWLRHGGASAILSWNDGDYPIGGEEKRENGLKEEFAKHGVEVKFVGKKRKS